jgi:formate hydrogenlyase subunit 6/NADH:ubiquinone oxidoreductase subunit I
MMPWVNQDMCVGCGVCVNDCPVGAIALERDAKAVIDEENCIRCGRCHEICPQDAVRHDSERIPLEVAANIERTRRLLQHYRLPDQQQSFLERMARYFKKEQKVARLTVEKLTAMKDDVNKRN